MKKTLILIALFILILGCTSTTTQQPAAAVPASNFKNVQILPRDLTREQLLAVMRSFTRGLGVRCNHCHVVMATEPKEELDFPSDAKEEKRVARVMWQMVQQVNGAWMERVDKARDAHEAMAAPGEARVVCWTCHRGKPLPEAPPPSPQRNEPPKQ